MDFCCSVALRVHVPNVNTMNVATKALGLSSRLSRTRPIVDVGGGGWCLQHHWPPSFRERDDNDGDRDRVFHRNDRPALLLRQKREYHATRQSPLVLYGVIIVFAAGGYVIWRKSRGEPITPYSLTEAKKTFEEHDGKFSRAAFERRQAEKLRKNNNNNGASESDTEKTSEK